MGSWYPFRICFLLWVIDWHVMLCRYVSVSGFHGVLAGFMVAVKQIMPDQEVPFLLKLRAKVKKASSMYVTSHCSHGSGVSYEKTQLQGLDFEIVWQLWWQCIRQFACWRCTRIFFACFGLLTVISMVWWLQWLPSMFVLSALIASIILNEPMHFVPFIVFGTYGAWLYLRYLQRKPEAGFKGDASSEFALTTFFPGFLQ